MVTSNKASPQATLGFARQLLVELRQRRPEAQGLEARGGREGAQIGLQDAGEWVPLLKVTGGTAACNVMWLQVSQGSRWVPTGLRGTPATLAQPLAERYSYLWSLALQAVGIPPNA